jgi:hypothetical protein
MPHRHPHGRHHHSLLQEGVESGLIGGVIVATWFLILDLLKGQPLATPSILGQLIILGRGTPDTTRLVPEAIASYSFLHFGGFILFGMGVCELVHLAVRESFFRFALLVVFVVFEVFFLGVVEIFFQGTRGLFPGWQVLVANTLAAAGMGIYFWLRHPSLKRALRHEALGA